MSYFDYSFFEPGDSVAGLDTVIQDVEASLNDIPVDALPEGALNAKHIAAGKALLADLWGTLQVEETNDIAIYQVGRETVSYAAYGTDNAIDRNVLGNTADAGYLGPEAVIEGAALSFIEPLRAPDMRALWVKANVEIAKIGPEIEAVMVCIQVKTSSGGGVGVAWTTVDRTERFVTRADHVVADELVSIDVPIKTIITGADLPGLSDGIEGVRVMVSAVNGGVGSEFTVYRFNLSVLPLWIGTM